MNDMLVWLLPLLAAVVGVFLGHAFTLRRVPDTKHTIEPPKPPPKSPTKVQNETADQTHAAVQDAADAHGVPADVVSDGLEWLDSDDM